MGIGRPVDPEWLDNFEYNFYRSLGSIPAKLFLVKRPGVIYVDRDGLSNNMRSATPLITRSSDEESLVEGLVKRKVLDEESANAGLPGLYLWRFDKVPKERKIRGEYAYPIYARFNDNPDVSEPGHYQIYDEKLAVREALGTNELLPAIDRIPHHKAKIGAVVCDPNTLGKNFFKDLRFSMQEVIDLTKVGEILPGHTEARQ
jgi:hypothetical protein